MSDHVLTVRVSRQLLEELEYVFWWESDKSRALRLLLVLGLSEWQRRHQRPPYIPENAKLSICNVPADKRSIKPAKLKLYTAEASK